MDIKRRTKKLSQKVPTSKPKMQTGHLKRPSKTDEAQPDNSVPRITNESVAAHREEVLGSARKYIYPLRHSRHRVVKISITLFVLAIVSFFVGCVLALYKFQSTSTFMYSVTRIVPFPVAKVGKDYVSYDDYLFELRHYMHYYQSQQNVSFSSEDGKRQLASFKQRSMSQVITQAYVKKLADKLHLSVSNKEVNDQVALVRSQNRLGASDEVFRNVLREFWGWSVSDFKRELKSELLEQKVVAALDTDTKARANDALAKLNKGEDFEKLAEHVSDDAATREDGGEYGFTIDRSSRDIAPQAVEALYKLTKGQHTGIIDAGYFLEIDKLLDQKGTKLQAAHMTFNYKDISVYTKPLEKSAPTHYYLHL